MDGLGDALERVVFGFFNIQGHAETQVAQNVEHEVVAPFYAQLESTLLVQKRGTKERNQSQEQAILLLPRHVLRLKPLFPDKGKHS